MLQHTIERLQAQMRAWTQPFRGQLLADACSGGLLRTRSRGDLHAEMLHRWLLQAGQRRGAVQVPACVARLTPMLALACAQASTGQAMSGRQADDSNDCRSPGYRAAAPSALAADAGSPACMAQLRWQAHVAKMPKEPRRCRSSAMAPRMAVPSRASVPLPSSSTKTSVRLLAVARTCLHVVRTQPTRTGGRQAGSQQPWPAGQTRSVVAAWMRRLVEAQDCQGAQGRVRAASCAPHLVHLKVPGALALRRRVPVEGAQLDAVQRRHPRSCGRHEQAAQRQQACRGDHAQDGALACHVGACTARR